VLPCEHSRVRALHGGRVIGHGRRPARGRGGKDGARQPSFVEPARDPRGPRQHDARAPGLVLFASRWDKLAASAVSCGRATTSTGNSCSRSTSLARSASRERPSCFDSVDGVGGCLCACITAGTVQGRFRADSARSGEEATCTGGFPAAKPASGPHTHARASHRNPGFARASRLPDGKGPAL
jgi:hypothetical protein